MEVEHVDYQRLSWLWRRERLPSPGGSRSPGGTVSGKRWKMNSWPFISHVLPSRELTYPVFKALLKMIFLFPQVGYVNSLEGSR